MTFTAVVKRFEGAAAMHILFINFKRSVSQPGIHIPTAYNLMVHAYINTSF